MAKAQGLETGKDMEETLRLIRSQELQAAEVATKRRMVEMGRCPVCTLVIPCQHYQSRSELPVTAANSPVAAASNAIGGGSERLVHSLQLGTGTELPSVRFRGPAGVIYRKKRSQSQNEGRKTELRRIKLLEQLDRYREERLRKEIAKIEEMKRREEAEYRERLVREQKRHIRDQQLKKQLADYQERKLREQQDRQFQFLEASQRDKAISRRIHLHVQRQKQLLSNYHHKAQIIDSIEREQVAELGKAHAESDVLEARV